MQTSVIMSPSPLWAVSVSGFSLWWPWQPQEACPGALRVSFNLRLSFFFFFFVFFRDRVSLWSSGCPGTYLCGPGCSRTHRDFSYIYFNIFSWDRGLLHCQASLELLDSKDAPASAFQVARNTGVSPHSSDDVRAVTSGARCLWGHILSSRAQSTNRACGVLTSIQASPLWSYFVASFNPCWSYRKGSSAHHLPREAPDLTHLEFFNAGAPEVFFHNPLLPGKCHVTLGGEVCETSVQANLSESKPEGDVFKNLFGTHIYIFFLPFIKDESELRFWVNCVLLFLH